MATSRNEVKESRKSVARSLGIYVPLKTSKTRCVFGILIRKSGKTQRGICLSAISIKDNRIIGVQGENLVSAKLIYGT